MEEVEAGVLKSESREKGLDLPVIECLDEKWFYKNALKLVPSSPDGSSCHSTTTEMLNLTEANANRASEEVGSANIRGNVDGTPEEIVHRPCLVRTPSLPPRFGGKESSHGGNGTPDRTKHDLLAKCENRGCSSMKVTIANLEFRCVHRFLVIIGANSVLFILSRKTREL